MSYSCEHAPAPAPHVSFLVKESCTLFIQERTLKPTVVCLKLLGPEVAREMARLEKRRVASMARIRTRPSVVGLS